MHEGMCTFTNTSVRKELQTRQLEKKLTVKEGNEL